MRTKNRCAGPIRGCNGIQWESQGLRVQNLDFSRQEGDGPFGHVPCMGSFWVVAEPGFQGPSLRHMTADLKRSSGLFSTIFPCLTAE